MGNRKPAQFFENLRGKKVAFIGVGVSNSDCIRLFVRQGAEVWVLDRKNEEQLGELFSEFSDLGVSFVLGERYLDDLRPYDFVVRAPGVYFHHPKLAKARDEGVVITSEIELFFALCPCKIFGITGSDGKTTTTTIIAELLTRAGKTVHKGGNIGRALLPVVQQIGESDAAVVELSSFQLISMRQSPDVAVITNLSPNHLDVHSDMQEYIDSKKNLLWHQDGFSAAVLNLDNEITRSMLPLVRGEKRGFSRENLPKKGAALTPEGFLTLYRYGEVIPVLHKDEIKLLGMHNVENFLAAFSAVIDDVSPETMAQVAREFAGVAHRMELVREKDGVKWYNDSIASSPTRTIAGLSAFSQKILLIAGGYDKKIPYDPLMPHLLQKVKHLILMGDTGPIIEKTLQNFPGYDRSNPPVYRVKTMEEAVAKAQQLSRAGDVVALSPASASFDLYPMFEARGDHFKALVKNL